MIIQIKVIDEYTYSKYIERVKSIVEKCGGRYLVRGGRVTPLAGSWNPQRVVLIEFDSLAQMRSCFRSEEYREIAKLREKSTISKSILVEGLNSIAQNKGGEKTS